MAAFGTVPPRSARVVRETAYGEDTSYLCARIFCHCCQKYFSAHFQDQHETSSFLREQQTQEEWEDFIGEWKHYLYAEADRAYERQIAHKWEVIEAGMEWEEEESRRELEEEERRREEERYCAVEASVILGRDFAGQSVTVTAEQMCSGAYLLGTQGSGKSSLLAQIALQRMEQQDSVIVLDPHGQLVDTIIARIPQSRLTDTHLLDLSDARRYPFRLNIFHCSKPGDETERARTRGRVLRIFRRIWPEIEAGQYVEKMLRHVTTTLIYNPGCTLADVPAWFRKPGIPAQTIAKIKDANTRAFWAHDLPSLSPRDFSFQTEPFLGRVSRLLSDDLLRRLLCTPGPPLDFGQLIRQRRSLLVKLPVDADVIGEAASLAGVALFSLIYATTFDDQPKDHRDSYTLIVDEFQNFVTSEFVRLFVGGRKYGAKLVLAHQYMGQLDLPGLDVNRRGVLTARTVVSFHTTPYDAAEVAPLYAQLEKNWARENLVADVAAALERHPVEAVKKFALRHVAPLIQGARLQGNGYPVKLDFGWGTQTFRPENARRALTLLNDLLYEAQRSGRTSDRQRRAVVQAIADVPSYGSPDEAEKLRLDADLSAVIAALIAEPIVEYQPVGSRTVATQLPSLPPRTAFVKAGEWAHHMETFPLPQGVDAKAARERVESLMRQTHREYCSTQTAVDEQILNSPCRQNEPTPATVKPPPPMRGPVQAQEPQRPAKPPPIGRRSPKRPDR
ncbi:hypothetical protein ACH4YO_23420 [Streptomyces noursei]|uniref:hypothetical protein n=1 Tax=Streptomyces noursei TaxID=1971 RepID=UPI0033DE9D73